MPVTNDQFDQLKIDKLKHFLADMAAKGQPRPFEIFVDNLKVVPKTEDPKEFDNYEYYLNEDTERIRVLIYNSNLSPRNDQYCFYVQQHKQDKSLQGLGDIDNIIQEKLSARDREHELSKLKQELEETKKQLEESEEYAESLEEQLEEAKNNKYKIGKLDLVDLGALAIGRFAEKNAGLLAKVGLEGLGSSEQKEMEARPETEASFQKKQDTAPQVDPAILPYLSVLQQLQATLNEEQLETAMRILGQFIIQPIAVTKAAEFLKIQTQ